MFRVSVSDNWNSNNWEVVLTGSLTHRWNNSEPLPLPIEELELDVAVVDKQFVKFEVVSHYRAGGGLEYFDIVRTGAAPGKLKAELKRECSRRSDQCPGLAQFCPHPQCVSERVRWADQDSPGQVHQGCSFTTDGLRFSSEPRCLSKVFTGLPHTTRQGVVLLDARKTTFLPCRAWSDTEPFCPNKQGAVVSQRPRDNVGNTFRQSF